jgi:hypothetical protein
MPPSRSTEPALSCKPVVIHPFRRPSARPTPPHPRRDGLEEEPYHINLASRLVSSQLHSNSTCKRRAFVVPARFIRIQEAPEVVHQNKTPLHLSSSQRFPLPLLARREAARPPSAVPARGDALLPPPLVPIPPLFLPLIPSATMCMHATTPGCCGCESFRD